MKIFVNCLATNDERWRCCGYTSDEKFDDNIWWHLTPPDGDFYSWIESCLSCRLVLPELWLPYWIIFGVKLSLLWNLSWQDCFKFTVSTAKNSDNFCTSLCNWYHNTFQLFFLTSLLTVRASSFEMKNVVLTHMPQQKKWQVDTSKSIDMRKYASKSLIFLEVDASQEKLVSIGRHFYTGIFDSSLLIRQKHINFCQCLQVYFWTFLNILEYFWTFLNIYKMFKTVQKYSITSIYEQTL